MCIGCHWANYREYFANASTAGGGGLTRRQVLRRGAGFAASAVAAFSPRRRFVAEAVAAEDASADIVFRNGPVYTVELREAVGARSGGQGQAHRLSSATRRAIQSFIGPQTRVVDLAGKMLLPGFVEGHIHPLVGATITRGADLQQDTREDVLAALKAYRDKVGKVDIVRGYGWRYGAFPATGPRKEDLDAIWPDVARHPDRHRRPQRLGQLADARARRRHEGHQGSDAGVQHFRAGSGDAASPPAISSRSRP